MARAALRTAVVALRASGPEAAEDGADEGATPERRPSAWYSQTLGADAVASA